MLTGCARRSQILRVTRLLIAACVCVAVCLSLCRWLKRAHAGRWLRTGALIVSSFSEHPAVAAAAAAAAFQR